MPSQRVGSSFPLGSWRNPKGGMARGYKSGCVREKCCFKAGYVNERGRGAKAFSDQIYCDFLIECPA